MHAFAKPAAKVAFRSSPFGAYALLFLGAYWLYGFICEWWFPPPEIPGPELPTYVKCPKCGKYYVIGLGHTCPGTIM